jgi:hypothetical protein
MPQTVLVHADGERVDYELHLPFRECRLVSMTTPTGERGIACQMQIEPESLRYLRQYPGGKPTAVQTALQPLPADPPNQPNLLLTLGRGDAKLARRVRCSG